MKKMRLDPKLNLEKITKLNDTLKDFEKAWETGDLSIVKPELYEMGLLSKGRFSLGKLQDKFNRWREEDSIKQVDKFLKRGLDLGEEYMSNTSRPTRGLQIRGEHPSEAPAPTPFPGPAPGEDTQQDMEGIEWDTQKSEEVDFGGAEWDRAPSAKQNEPVDSQWQAPRFDMDYEAEDPGLQGPPSARGEFLEPERNVITSEAEVEVVGPEVDEREKRRDKINSFLKQQGAYKRGRRRIG